MRSTNPHTITEDIDFLQIMEIFRCKKTRRLPVVKDDKLVGIVSRSDMLKVVGRFRKKNKKKGGTDLPFLSHIRENYERPGR